MNPKVARGMALHKMIRLLTQSLGGEGYLNFMGNEFGHPEWIDFPREGNNFSYHYCRRQWNLLRDQNLRYGQLCQFDKKMNQYESVLGLMRAEHQYLTFSHEEDKLIVYEKGAALFIFNFHTSKSYENYKVGTEWGTDHILLFDTDQEGLGGHGRLNSGYSQRYVPKRGPWQNRARYVNLYLPCRSAMVLIAEENLTPEITEKLQIVLPPIQVRSAPATEVNSEVNKAS